jgi:glycosyltransferase involved in cell wall biosynthesis
VQIVAANFSHVRARQPKAGDEVIDGVAYRWLPTPPYRGNGAGRVWNIARFLSQVWWQSRRLVTDFKPDVVIASSTYPMDFWPARHLARQAGAKLVFEVHDLWPLSPIELGGMSPAHPFIRVCQWAENAAYRDADLVVSMLPTVADYVSAKGLDASRLAIVPNGISLDEWQQASPEPVRADVRQALDMARDQGCMVVGYAGSHGLPNALDTLLDAAAMLAGAPVRFVLVGDGHERERLCRRAREEQLHNVAMFEPIPKGQVPDFLSRVQAAYLGAPREAIYRFGVSPNKLIDYMMAGVPVLYAIEAGNDPVADADCGLAVPAVDPAALSEAINRLRLTSPERLEQMGENGRRYAQQHHTYPALARRFIDALLATTKKR